MGIGRSLSFSTGLLAAFACAGCGMEDGANAPSIKLSATKPVQSTLAPADNHFHTISIPFADPGSSSQVNYVSSSSTGHTHTVALSAAQFTDLKSGMRVNLTSTTDSGHNHNWTVYGGSYLYESICYNCHSDDKRGVSGMGSNPSDPAQRAALQNPSTAPLSTATPANPGVAPVQTTTLDGAALYASSCATCHGPLATSPKKGRTASQIRSAINADRGGMGILSGLSDAQLQAIATALNIP